MRTLLLSVLASAALLPAGGEARPGEHGPASAAGLDRPPIDMRRSDQAYARDAMRAGAVRPLRDITTQWRVDMPGYDFIGSEFDPDAGSYRLKFMRQGSVVWVDVDGRGREIRRSGR